MKHLTKFLAFVAFIFVAQTTFGQGITGTKHDFGGAAWNSTTEKCIVCHTPHGAKTGVADAPLWNHEITAVATYTLYTNAATLDATLGQPSGASKLCLSCHDGSIALDDFGGTTTGTNMIPVAAQVATGGGNDDLSANHPISFTYDATLASNDGGLFDPTSLASKTTALGGTIQNDLLFSNQVQCASCHDVHNANGNTSLLTIDNSTSGLCLTCHNK